MLRSFLFPSEVDTMTICMIRPLVAFQGNLSPTKKSSTEFCLPGEVPSLQQSFIPPSKGFHPSRRVCCLGVILNTAARCLFREITVLPWSSLSMSNLRMASLSRSYSVNLIFSRSLQFIFAAPFYVCGPFLLVARLLFPAKLQLFEVPSLAVPRIFSSPLDFCNLFLQVMSDSDFLVIGFSIGHSPVKLLNIHHYIASTKMRSISIIWNI